VPWALKDVRERWQSISDVRFVMEAALVAETAVATPPKARSFQVR
jgi:hypothetical protein